MSLVSELKQRGILFQSTDEAALSKALQSPVVFYCGFDPTSSSLHVGSMLPLVTMRRLQLAGHRPIVVVGGATGMIGDPSGKTTERVLMTPDVIATNIEGIKKSVSRFLSFEGPAAAIIVNNYDWTGSISYIHFLREIGKHFTINHMMAKESVRARLEDREHGISYTEFSYMLLQAFDFAHLADKMGCTLQIGGSDQWGNITAGIELTRRLRAHAEPVEHAHLHGFTFPLVTKADGQKFGKSESGTVWIDAEKTSPYQFYQFFLQTPDSDVIKLIRFFSFKSLEEIARLEEAVKTAPEKREAQQALARELTALVHGEEELARITQASEALFSKDIRTLDLASLKQVFAEAPTVTVGGQEFVDGQISLVDLLVRSGLCPSKGAARKEIQGGGIYLNNERCADAAAFVSREKDTLHGSVIVLRKGKKNYALVQVE
jgi:tyrosyl-tRNA synthetase